jgi:hypothetical protein
MAFDIVPDRPGRPARPEPIVFFDRAELRLILGLYGRMVASGKWRDYAIAGLKEAAVFSIFARTSERPIFRIEKRPGLARRQGAWLVAGHDGRILRRGHDLAQVIAHTRFS